MLRKPTRILPRRQDYAVDDETGRATHYLSYSLAETLCISRVIGDFLKPRGIGFCSEPLFFYDLRLGTNRGKLVDSDQYALRDFFSSCGCMMRRREGSLNECDGILIKRTGYQLDLFAAQLSRQTSPTVFQRLEFCSAELAGRR